ncbi:MAG: FAD-dependent oxidoreductase [Oligoflexus sp.]|nr:FAD-dependent oxidoreductase [Oligoflexus sp.]
MHRRKFVQKSFGYLAGIPLLSQGFGCKTTDHASNLKDDGSPSIGAVGTVRGTNHNTPNGAFNLRYSDIGLASMENGVFPMHALGENIGRAFAADAEALRRHLDNFLNTPNRPPLKIMGGGHSYIGASVGQGAHVINMRPLSHIEFNPSANEIRVGAGCAFHEVLSVLWNYNRQHNSQWALPTGDCPNVGVSGYTMGGGQSLLSPMLGLGCDRVKSMTVITLDYNNCTQRFEPTLRKLPDPASIMPVQDKDLLWALKGGGSWYGVVCDITYNIEQLPKSKIYCFTLKGRGAEEAQQVFKDWCFFDFKSAQTSSKFMYDMYQGIKIMGVTPSDEDFNALMGFFNARKRGEDFVRVHKDYGSDFNLENMYYTFSGCEELRTCGETSVVKEPTAFCAASAFLNRDQAWNQGRVMDLFRKILEPNDYNPKPYYTFVQFSRWTGRIKDATFAKNSAFAHRNAPDYETQIYVSGPKSWSPQWTQWVDQAVGTLGTKIGSFLNHANANIERDLAPYLGTDDVEWGKSRVQKLSEIHNFFDPKNVLTPFQEAKR